MMHLRLAPLLALPAALLGLGVGVTGALALEGDWHAAQRSRLRLIGGTDARPVDGKASTRIYAGVEVVLEKGWKTYWRVPGDSGVPPGFDWSASKNLAEASVLYPAPHRFQDDGGAAIGYKDHVIFPVLLTPTDAEQPIELALALEIGVCEKICIPVEAKLTLTVPPAASGVAMPAALGQQLARVPAAASIANAPRITAARAQLAEPKPSLEFDVQFPAGASGVDMFIEGPDGTYVPLPEPMRPASNGAARFKVDLSNGVDIKDIAGKPLRITLVSDKASAEVIWVAK